MNLHSRPELFEQAVIAASQRYSIPEIYIEKDYWVTLALHAIFHSRIAGEAVFKGGTALSKCHQLIERFSEDVDMVVLQKKGESANQLKNKLKAITAAVSALIPEIEISGLTNKKGMIRKTAHAYPKQKIRGDFGQVREQIVVEASWLGSSEPYITAEVSCYIANLMKELNQDALIAEFSMEPFAVNVLSKERTLCEKIMSLDRFSQTQEPYKDPADKIRHIYDLHFLLKDRQVADFFKTSAFEDLLNQVGKDDLESYKNNNEWLHNHPANSLMFAKAEDTWDKIKTNYRTTFKDIVTGTLPEEKDLVSTLETIYRRLLTVEWRVGMSEL